MASKQTEEKKPQHSHGQRYLNGALSGFVEVTLTHWVDVLKTRLQAEKETTKGINVRNLSNRIWAQEGFRGFYKGYVSRMFGIGPMRATFWGTMDTMNHFLHDSHLSVIQKLLLAGVVGGAAQSVVDTPIEIAKTALITGSKKPVGELVSDAVKFRGGAATFSRNMIFAAVMNVGINYDRKPDASSVETMIRAGLSGVFAATITQPLDYVKTKQQQSGAEFYKVNFIRLLIDTGKKSVPLLFTGLISRATLSIATMSVSGTVFKILNKLQHKEVPK